MSCIPNIKVDRRQWESRRLDGLSGALPGFLSFGA